MFRKYIFLLLAALFCASNSFALELRPYAGIKLGMSDMNIDYAVDLPGIVPGQTYGRNIFSGAAALGAQYKFLRAEIEYSAGDYASKDKVMNSPFDVKSRLFSYMFNVYYDFPVDGKLSPYFMGGLGVSDMEYTFSDSTFNNTAYSVFTYALGCGLSYALTGNIILDANFRYRKPDETVKFKKLNIASEMASYDFYLGVRYAL